VSFLCVVGKVEEVKEGRLPEAPCCVEVSDW
jgi:hypothetical protein